MLTQRLPGLLLCMAVGLPGLSGCHEAEVPGPPLPMVERLGSGGNVFQVHWESVVASAESGAAPSLREVQSIGSDSGLTLHEVIGAQPLEGDRWLIGQASSPFMRAWDGGTAVEVLRGPGEGPGEVTRLNWVGWAPGGAAAYSAREGKFVFVDGDLEIRSERVVDRGALAARGISTATFAGGILDDGRAVLSAPISGSRPQQFQGLVRGMRAVFVADSQGGVADPLLETPDSEIGGRQRSLPGGDRVTVYYPRPPLGKRTHVAAAGSTVFVMETGANTIRGVNAEGAERLVLSFPPGAESPSPDQIERGIEHVIAGSRVRSESEARRVLGELVSQGPPPVIGGFIPVTDDLLWVWLDPAVVSEPGLIARLDLASERLELFRLPEGLAPLGADRNRVWGTTESEFGVQTFRVMAVP
jgi:hypothetical protein